MEQGLCPGSLMAEAAFFADNDPHPERSVLLVGDVNIDRIYQCPSLVPGTEQIALEKSTTAAGSAGYFSLALARLNRAVRMASSVGDDADGREIIAALNTSGVDTSLLSVIQGGVTGETIIVIDPEQKQDRQMMTFPGVLEGFDYLPSALDALADLPSLIHSTSYFVLKQLQGTLCSLFDHARTRKIITSFDPNSGDDWADPKVRSFLFEELIPRLDVLFVNEDEARALTGVDKASEALQRFRQHCPELLVNIKLGSQGAIGGKGDACYRVPSFPPAGRVMDAVGAGDTFGATFIDALLRDLAPEVCAALASVNASCTLTHAGPTAGQKTLQELKHILVEYRFECLKEASTTSDGIPVFGLVR